MEFRHRDVVDNCRLALVRMEVSKKIKIKIMSFKKISFKEQLKIHIISQSITALATQGQLQLII